MVLVVRILLVVMLLVIVIPLVVILFIVMLPGVVAVRRQWSCLQWCRVRRWQTKPRVITFPALPLCTRESLDSSVAGDKTDT